MAALEIQCFLNENQMSAIAGYVSDWLYKSDRDMIEDIDICFDTMKIRVCVEFVVGFDSVELKQAEVLDEYWNIIDADSAVLRSRLKVLLWAYNDSENMLRETCRSARYEQQHQLFTY